MNWTNLLWLVIAAAHTTAGIFYLLLGIVLYAVQEAGLSLWIVPGGCLVLLVMDLTGKVNLREVTAKTLAALLLPLLCSYVEAIFWGEDFTNYTTPEVKVWVFAQLLLAVYVLLRGKKTDDPLSKAELLLNQGSALYVVLAIWLMVMGGAVLFMLTFGLPISMIVGGLIAERNDLLDYCGLKGLLTGLLILYLLQSLWFCRGAQLARRDELEQDNSIPLLSLFVPVWNQIQAQRLSGKLLAYRLRQGRDQMWAEL